LLRERTKRKPRLRGRCGGGLYEYAADTDDIPRHLDTEPVQTP